jgi:pyridoxine kinase
VRECRSADSRGCTLAAAAVALAGQRTRGARAAARVPRNSLNGSKQLCPSLSECPSNQHTMAEGRVLSVQSHVVRGYVGNKSAVFPMQLLGLEVDPVNSVQFSNHTGYADGFTGESLSGEQLGTLVDGLEQNGLLCGYTHLLTGYIGSVSFLRQVLQVVAKLRAVNPGLIFVCDPVMGDEGRIYVAEELVAVYRDEVVALATVLTPNQFEAELLSGEPIQSIAAAAAACDILHARGPRVILLTSCDFGADEEQEHLTVVVSALPAGAAKGTAAVRHVIVVPKLPSHFTGTGDLVASLFLAWYHREHTDAPQLAAEKAVATVQVSSQSTASERRTAPITVRCRSMGSDGQFRLCSEDCAPRPRTRVLGHRPHTFH